MATILDWLEGHAKVLRVSNPEVFIECPSCGTRKLKCSINIHKGIGRCFRASCAFHSGFGFGRLIQSLTQCSPSEAARAALEYSDEVEKEFKPKASLYPRDYPRNALPLDSLLHVAQESQDKEKESLVNLALDNLTGKRGLSLDQIRRFQIGVGFADFEVLKKEKQVVVPRFGMLVIPIYFNGDLVSYTSRSLEADGVLIGKQKHNHAIVEEGYVPIGQMLFNCDVAFEAAQKAGRLVVVEDAWTPMKLPNAVGTLGSNLSEDQIHLLCLNWQGPVVVCRDNDRGGHTSAELDRKKLAGFYSDVRVVFPSGIDPDDDLEETKRRILASSPSNAFESQLLSMLKK